MTTTTVPTADLEIGDRVLVYGRYRELLAVETEGPTTYLRLKGYGRVDAGTYRTAMDATPSGSWKVRREVAA